MFIKQDVHFVKQATPVWANGSVSIGSGSSTQQTFKKRHQTSLRHVPCLPEGCGHDIAQGNEQLSACCKHIWDGLHDPHNSSTDGILVRLHEGLKVLAASNDRQKRQ